MSAAIWFGGAELSLESVQAKIPSRPTLVQHLGIELDGVGPDWLAARMPVDIRTHQPMGLLHGGASVVLAETLASVASFLCVDARTYSCVGLEINANHLRGVSEGWVHGVCRPLHLGRSTHVWDIRIHDDGERAICVSRCTMAVIERR